jgi:hypothetical protein
MKRIIECLAVTFIAVCPVAVSGAEAISVPNSTSPDGAYHFRVVAPIEKGGSSSLALVPTRGGEPVGSTVLGSYAAYPLVADPANLGFLWAGDSKYFALMVRGTKRSWTVRIHSAEDRELKSIAMPSATSKALAILGVSDNHRVCRESPQKWLDADHFVVRASGDAEVDKHVIWYEVEITYSISTKTITDSKLISTVPHDG